MAWEFRLMDVPAALAGVDFSGRNGGTTNGYQSTGQFLFVKLTADNTYAPCAIGDMPTGVSQTNPVAGSGTLGDFTGKSIGVGVRAKGVSKIMVGAADLSAGDVVGPDANGAAVKRVLTSGGADAGRFVGGYILEGASAGNLATMMVVEPVIIQA